MARYKVAPGRAVGKKNGSGVIRSGDPLPDLSPADIARFLADGSIVLDEAVEKEPPQETAPSPISPPGEGADSAPGFSVPSKWPSIKNMPAYLEGLSAAEVRFLQANDSRVSAASEQVYRDALAALEAE